MSEAPERIWAWEYKGNSPWGPIKPDLDVVTNGAEYVRADRIEELESENKRLNEQMAAIEEMGTESLNALPDCLMRLAPALVENDELKAKLAKAMKVIEMIASADVDAVLGEAVDISCEIIGELMEEEEDE